MEISRDRPLSQEEQKLYLNRCNEAMKHELEEYKIETFEIPRFECFKVFDMIDRGRKIKNELGILKEEMVKSVETASNVIGNDSNIIPNILWDNVTLHQVEYFQILLGQLVVTTEFELLEPIMRLVDCNFNNCFRICFNSILCSMEYWSTVLSNTSKISLVFSSKVEWKIISLSRV